MSRAESGSVSGDSYSMSVIAREPPIDDQSTRELTANLDCVLVMLGDDVGLGWDHADGRDVSTSG